MHRRHVQPLTGIFLWLLGLISMCFIHPLDRLGSRLVL